MKKAAVLNAKASITENPATESAAGTVFWLLHRLHGGNRKEGRTLLLMMAAVFLVVLLNTVGQVRLNQWQGAFYNALERHDFNAFLTQLGVFFMIMTGLLVLVVTQTWVTETLKVRARRWVTEHVLAAWLLPRRAYLLGFAGDVSRNPDQRISQDTSQLTDLSISFTIGLGQATLLLSSFVGVLWTLSSSVVFTYHGTSFTIPGYMVWCALLFTALGSSLTYIVGRPLVAGNAERFAREGAFRTDLVRISENAKVISLEGGEPGESQVTARSLADLVATLQKLVNARTRLTWITSGYGWIGLVAPIVIAAPGYFTGNMTLGSLIMVVGGFNQVQNSLRWFIDNYPNIAEWQAVLQRVTSLLASLEALESEQKRDEHIAAVTGGPGKIIVDNLAVCLPGDSTTCVLLEQRHVEIVPGDRVLFFGAPGSGKTTLFMALAGLWPWGHGTITRPQAMNAMFLSERPYIPEGTLLQAIMYPAAEAGADGEAAAAALAGAGLPHLVAQIGVSNHWDTDLSLGEQQRLGIARLLLHRPDWAFLDDCLSALDDSSSRNVLAMLKAKLPKTAFIATSHRHDREDFYTRVVKLDGASSLPPFRFVNGVAQTGTAA